MTPDFIRAEEMQGHKATVTAGKYTGLVQAFDAIQTAAAQAHINELHRLASTTTVAHRQQSAPCSDALPDTGMGASNSVVQPLAPLRTVATQVTHRVRQLLRYMPKWQA